MRRRDDETLVKRLRGVLGIGSVWGLVRGVVGAAIGGSSGFITGSLIGALVIGGVGAGLMGFVLGSGFATVLTLMDGKKTLEQLTPRRAGVPPSRISCLEEPQVVGIRTD